MEVIVYKESLQQEWDAFVESSNNGTMFHLQKFFAYHKKNKFNFQHLLFYKKGKIIALLPAGRVGEMIKSPVGASFGGFVIPKELTITDADELVKSLIRYCASLKIKEIYITPPMQIYNSMYNEVIEYSMLYNHFILLSSLYSSVIDFSAIRGKQDLSRNTKHKINTAQNKNVKIVQHNDFEAFYPILLENKTKFNVQPTHALEELKKIDKLLPGRLVLFLAYYKNKPIAGELLFVANKNCVLNFYTMHLYEFRNLFAVNSLIYHSMIWCIEHGYKYYDYGVSADTFSSDPMEPSWSLINFKESMGATGCIRKTFYRRVF